MYGIYTKRQNDKMNYTKIYALSATRTLQSHNTPFTARIARVDLATVLSKRPSSFLFLRYVPSAVMANVDPSAEDSKRMQWAFLHSHHTRRIFFIRLARKQLNFDAHKHEKKSRKMYIYI